MALIPVPLLEFFFYILKSFSLFSLVLLYINGLLLDLLLNGVDLFLAHLSFFVDKHHALRTLLAAGELIPHFGRVLIEHLMLVIDAILSLSGEVRGSLWTRAANTLLIFRESCGLDLFPQGRVRLCAI